MPTDRVTSLSRVRKLPKTLASSVSMYAAATMPRQLTGSPAMDTTNTSLNASVKRWRSTSVEDISLRQRVLSTPEKLNVLPATA